MSNMDNFNQLFCLSENDLEKIRLGKGALITDIQRFCVHDGPGIRTIVFFKGCPLRCQWCQTPETYSAVPEMLYSRQECLKCGACITDCPQCAIQMCGDTVITDWEKCVGCGRCMQHCYTDSRKVVGKLVTLEQMMDEMHKDAAFYRNSGGGVTLSGGEVLLYHKFAAELLRQLKKLEYHTAIETSGYGKWEDFKEVLKYTDLLLYDMKHPDPEMHKRYTGVDNTLILANLRLAAQMGKKIILRVPLIQGVNDSEKTIASIGCLAKDLGVPEVHILPFHQAGSAKWTSLGKEYKFAEVSPYPESELERVKKSFDKMQIEATIGGGGV